LVVLVATGTLIREKVTMGDHEIEISETAHGKIISTGKLISTEAATLMGNEISTAKDCSPRRLISTYLEISMEHEPLKG